MTISGVVKVERIGASHAARKVRDSWCDGVGERPSNVILKIEESKLLLLIFSRLDNKFVLNHARLLTCYENSFLSHHHHTASLCRASFSIPSQVTGEWRKILISFTFFAAQRHWYDIMLMLMMMQIKLFIIIRLLTVIFHHESDRLKKWEKRTLRKKNFSSFKYPSTLQNSLFFYLVFSFTAKIYIVEFLQHTFTVCFSTEFFSLVWTLLAWNFHHYHLLLRWNTPSNHAHRHPHLHTYELCFVSYLVWEKRKRTEGKEKK